MPIENPMPDVVWVVRLNTNRMVALYMKPSPFEILEWYGHEGENATITEYGKKE